jgi:hypothetical protein
VGRLTVRARLALLCVGTALAAGVHAQVGWATPADMVAELNAKREANGIPAGITLRDDWTQACKQHTEYMSLNSGQTHNEEPGKPGYTPEGAWAGRNSVLGGPFEEAPFHLIQLLAPQLAEMGVYGSCLTTWPGYTRPAPPIPVIYTYPGDGTRIYYKMRASEDPAPGQFLGLNPFDYTGPHIYVLPFGVGTGRITAASLTGPAGPVKVGWVDSSTPNLGGSYLSMGGIVIPAKPLRPKTTYRASVTFVSDKGESLKHDWSFQTFKRDPDFWIRPQSTINVHSKSPAPVTLTVSRLPSGRVLARRKVHSNQPWNPKLGGRVRVCAVQPANDDYEGAQECDDETWAKVTPDVRVAWGGASVALTVGKAARGRPVVVRFTRHECPPDYCKWGHGKGTSTVRRTVKLATRTVIPYPRKMSPYEILDISIKVAGFTRGGVPYGDYTNGRTYFR